MNEKAYKAVIKDSKGLHAVPTESLPTGSAGLVTLDKDGVIHINCKLSDHCDNGDEALVSQLSDHTDCNSEELDSQPLVMKLGKIWSGDSDIVIGRLKL